MGYTGQIAQIHGGMHYTEREGQVERFRAPVDQGGARFLVCTDAAGEGINLQFCWIMINYDVPWNPARLEQRMGRIHRYGQIYDCLIFNFVATNTIEGRILERLWEKLQEIRNALDDDAVFNVVGEILPAAQLERVLRDYYAGKMGEADLEDRVLRDVSEDRFRNICQNALEGLFDQYRILAGMKHGGLKHALTALERLLNRRRPESPARNEDGEKLRIEAAPAHPGNVNVAFRITVAKIERAGKHPLRRVRVGIQDNRGEVKLVRALRNIIRGSAAGEKEPCT